MDSNKVIPHLFRTEFSKIVSVLSDRFGLYHIEVAEDIASETFLAALESWPHQGVPPNPVAWLYSVAKNKAKNFINRKANFSGKIVPDLKQDTPPEEINIELSDTHIKDSTVRMLFAVCHPSIPEESQIGLALRILCGFGIQEIADAFLTNKETINKRLFRAKEKLKSGQIALALPGDREIEQRLDTVLTTLYLLFNEGYYSESHDHMVRKDLCLEAMRLVYLLLENEETNKKRVNALMALMCFHASRLDARMTESDELVLYQDQDEGLWNQELIERGVYYLVQASGGENISKYHLEAGIAYWHTKKEDSKEKWENILGLYNQLLIKEYSPIAALNRTFVLSKVYGNEVAIKEAEKLNLSDNHYYFCLLGALYQNRNKKVAKEHYRKAMELAKTSADKDSILKLIQNS